MKKISTLMLSLAVAGSAMATVPSVKFEKAAPSFELSNVQISKVEANKTFGTDAAAMKKAPAKAPVSFADVAGQYIFSGEMDLDTGVLPISFDFEITAPDANGNVVIKNFFGGVFSDDPVNDLNAELYVETLSDGEQMTFLKLGIGQDLLSVQGEVCQIYLYGSYSGDGKNWVYTQDPIEFACQDGYIMGAYKSMALYIGYIDGDGLRGLRPIWGSGYYKDNQGNEVRNAVEGLKINTVMSADEYESNGVDTKPATYSVNTLYYEDHEAIIMTGVGGFMEEMVWYIDQENMTAQAVDQMMGYASDESGNEYEIWAYSRESSTEQNLIVEGMLSTDPATGNTIMTLPSQMVFGCEVGWLAKFDNTEFKYNFNFLKNAGIDNVSVDNNDNKPVEFFNLQGVKVNNPANGIYIRKQGTSVTKVLVK